MSFSIRYFGHSPPCPLLTPKLRGNTPLGHSPTQELTVDSFLTEGKCFQPMEARGVSDGQQAAAAAAAADAGLMVGSLDKYEDSAFGAELGAPVALQQPKRELEGGGADEYDEDEDDGHAHAHSGEFASKDGKLARAAKRSRRHNWQQKYEAEFGLLAIERDAVSGDVTLAMCGFCKTFGREGKYEQLVQADADTGNESKKRRRRSLTTTKFFRAFRVDNIRSHLQGAHPRRWAEYEMLPKQDAVRARYLQVQGDLQHYDNLAMVDDVVLGGSALNAESDMAYVQAQAQALAHTTLTEQHQAAAAQAAQAAAVHSGAAAVAALAAVSAPLNGGSHTTTPSLPSTSLVRWNRLVMQANDMAGD